MTAAEAVERREALPGHVCIVESVPACDLCGEPGYADVNLAIRHRALRGWGMVCKDHFDSLGCDTGVGVGQIWMVV